MDQSFFCCSFCLFVVAVFVVFFFNPLLVARPVLVDPQPAWSNCPIFFFVVTYLISSCAINHIIIIIIIIVIIIIIII